LTIFFFNFFFAPRNEKPKDVIRDSGEVNHKAFAIPRHIEQ